MPVSSRGCHLDDGFDGVPILRKGASHHTITPSFQKNVDLSQHSIITFGCFTLAFADPSPSELANARDAWRHRKADESQSIMIFLPAVAFRHHPVKSFPAGFLPRIALHRSDKPSPARSPDHAPRLRTVSTRHREIAKVPRTERTSRPSNMIVSKRHQAWIVMPASSVPDGLLGVSRCISECPTALETPFRFRRIEHHRSNTLSRTTQQPGLAIALPLMQ